MIELVDTHFHFYGENTPLEYLRRIDEALEAPEQRETLPVERLRLIAMGGDFVESCRAREFAGFCGTRTGFEYFAQQPSGREGTAVAMQFHGVFAGGAGGTGHENGQTGFSRSGVIAAADFAEQHLAGGGWTEGVFPLPDMLSDGECIRSGNTQDIQSSAGSGAESGNGIAIRIFLHIFPYLK